MISELFTNLMLALIFGASIGLERESSKQGESSSGSVGGIRTFSLISLLGAVAGIFVVHSYSSLALVVVIGFMVLLISNYITEGLTTHDFGITSELSAFVTFLIGLLLTINIIPLQITVAIFVTLVFVMSLKSRTTQLVAGVSRQEVQAFISYAIIALVALPVLPDYSYKLKDIPVLPNILQGLNVDLGKFDSLDLINPRKIWIVVVLITGIDVFGYILGRMVGNKNGFALTSFMAGFVSSTFGHSVAGAEEQKFQIHQSLSGGRHPGKLFTNIFIGGAVKPNLARVNRT